MIGEEAGTARGAGAADPRLTRYATELNEILRRVASIIGDIDVLKRERLSEALGLRSVAQESRLIGSATAGGRHRQGKLVMR